MDAKLKHLELIQAVITRMANNSFLLRGWVVTLVAALMALAAKDANTNFIIISFVPVLTFWLIDGYYLNQERLFRKHYDRVIIRDKDDINFSMNVSDIQSDHWFKVVLESKILLMFYLPLLFLIWMIYFLIF